MCHMAGVVATRSDTLSVFQPTSHRPQPRPPVFPCIFRNVHMRALAPCLFAVCQI